MSTRSIRNAANIVNAATIYSFGICTTFSGAGEDDILEEITFLLDIIASGSLSTISTYEPWLRWGVLHQALRRSGWHWIVQAEKILKALTARLVRAGMEFVWLQKMAAGCEFPGRTNRARKRWRFGESLSIYFKHLLEEWREFRNLLNYIESNVKTVPNHRVFGGVRCVLNIVDKDAGDSGHRWSAT